MSEHYQYGEDEWYEPSVLDEVMIDATAKLKGSIKSNVKEYFVAIESENERLKKENSVLKSREQEVNRKERELEIQKTDLLRQVKGEHLSKLMVDFQVVMYRIGAIYPQKDKCNKCNEDRKIKYISPLGKEMFEKCDCDIGVRTYIPEEYLCSEFCVNRRDGGMSMWFKLNKEGTEDEFYSYSSGDYVYTIFKENMDYKELERHRVYFKTSEDCQKYCDFLNTEEVETNG